MFGNPIPTFGWRRRIILYLQALCCRNQRIKGWDDNGKLIFTGWFDSKTQRTYITWMKKEQPLVKLTERKG